MNFKNNFWISPKLVFKWAWRRRWYSSMLTSSNMENVDQSCCSKKLLKYPESMFVCQNDVANNISNVICKHLTESYCNKQIQLIEANPGQYLITNHILKKTNYNISVFDNNSNIFAKYLKATQSNYGDRIHVYQDNLLLLWKYGFQDRMDRGDRVPKLLSNFDTPRPWNQEIPSFSIIAALPNKKFLNYLIYSFMFQTGLMTYGRPEFYFLLPPSVFTRYSAKPIVDIKYYNTQSILFQSIFNIELLKTYPRTAFLPPHVLKSKSKNVRFKELKEADNKCMVLTKVVGRREIFETDGLTEDLLKPYWYFVKHHTISRKNFVIPMLEQWIPGCGPHFIALGCTIFTQFGDLTPSQILCIFLKFISLPEYKNSPFLSSMENRIAKLLPLIQILSDESVDESCTNFLDFEEFNNKDG